MWLLSVIQTRLKSIVHPASLRSFPRVGGTWTLYSSAERNEAKTEHIKNLVVKYFCFCPFYSTLFKHIHFTVLTDFILAFNLNKNW